MLAQGLFTNRTTKTTDPFVSETTMRYIRLTAIACAVFIYPSVQANAQEADAPSEAGPDAATPAPTATAPRLLHAVEPDYPEAQRKQGRAASVGLVLIIDTEGRVTEATISDSAGDDFDQAALAAARQLVFEPARQGDRPVAAKIPFHFQFELAEAPPVEPAPAPPPAGAAGRRACG